MFRHVRLDKDDAPVWVKTCCNIDSRRIEDALLHLFRIVFNSNRMIIYDAKDTVVLIDHPHPVPNGSQVITDMHVPAGLNSAKKPLFHEIILIFDYFSPQRARSAQRSKRIINNETTLNFNCLCDLCVLCGKYYFYKTFGSIFLIRLAASLVFLMLGTRANRT